MNAGKNQILIVDDEPDIREVLELTLGRMNLETRSASNVEEARHLLEQFRFDLCLTDMRLPDGNGIGLVKHIQESYPNMPVAVITAFATFVLVGTWNALFHYVPPGQMLVVISKSSEDPSGIHSSG